MSDIKNKIIVKDSVINMRLDAYLSQVNAYPSRSVAAKFCDNGKVFLNGLKANKKTKINPGDQIEYDIFVENTEMVGQNIPLDVRYEDDDIMVISKQPGLICHPAPGQPDNTLVNALIYYCGKENLCNLTGDDSRLGIIHRLDGDTSGLLIVAKSNEAGEILSKAMKEHSTSRHYLALVYGVVKQNTGKIDIPLLRTVSNRPKMLASADSKAKNAITTFKTIERITPDKIKSKEIKSLYSGGFTLLDCQIHTGRTHQIRSHMEYINHPVVGDQLYNVGAPKGFDTMRVLGIKRQFLHSFNVEFEHPITHKIMKFEDDLPNDLQSALDIIR